MFHYQVVVARSFLRQVALFLAGANVKVEERAVQRLMALDEKGQTEVMARGPLREARDPTAIILSRCRKVRARQSLRHRPTQTFALY